MVGNEFFEQDRYTIVNTWVRICLETFMDILIACLLALHSPELIKLEGKEMNRFDKFNYGVAIFFLIVLGAFTVLAVVMTFIYRLPVKKERNIADSRRNRKLINFYRDRLNKEEVEEQED